MSILECLFFAFRFRNAASRFLELPETPFGPTILRRCDVIMYDSLVQKVGTMSYGLLCGHGSTLISGFFTLHTIVFRINEAHTLRRSAGFESGEEKATGGGHLGCGIRSRDELAGWVLE